MNIPVFSNYQWTKKENGDLTENAQMYMDELNNSMQVSLSDNGWTTPQNTTEQIDTIQSQMPNGTMWYDTTTNKMVIKAGGNKFALDMTPIP